MSYLCNELLNLSNSTSPLTFDLPAQEDVPRNAVIETLIEMNRELSTNGGLSRREVLTTDGQDNREALTASVLSNREVSTANGPVNPDPLTATIVHPREPLTTTSLAKQVLSPIVKPIKNLPAVEYMQTKRLNYKEFVTFDTRS